jgi:hypothetical protein
MNDNSLYSRRADLLETTLDNEVVLMSIERGSYFGLEGTARRIWQLLAQPMTKSQLVQALCLEYAAEPEVIARDLEPFLQKMIDNAVVVVS